MKSIFPEVSLFSPIVRIIISSLVTGTTNRDSCLISSFAPGLAVKTPLRQDVKKVRTTMGESLAVTCLQASKDG